MNKKSLRDMLNNQDVSPESLTPEQQHQFQQMKDTYNQYKDKKPGEIIDQINRMKNSREIRQMIRSGKIDELAQNLRPFLGSNAAKLDEVLRELKK